VGGGGDGGDEGEAKTHEGEGSGGSDRIALREIDVAHGARPGPASDGDPPEMFVKHGALHVINIPNLNASASAHLS
jgi:hypothetical protein